MTFPTQNRQHTTIARNEREEKGLTKIFHASSKPIIRIKKKTHKKKQQTNDNESTNKNHCQKLSVSIVGGTFIAMPYQRL